MAVFLDKIIEGTITMISMQVQGRGHLYLYILGSEAKYTALGSCLEMGFPDQINLGRNTIEGRKLLKQPSDRLPNCTNITTINLFMQPA